MEKSFREVALDFDDGHHPGSTNEQTQIFIHYNKAMSNFVQVNDNILPEPWIEFSYNYALRKGKPWGVFVSLNEFENFFESIPNEDDLNPEKSIAKASAYYMFSKISREIQCDRDNLCGVVVWCLSSDMRSEVKYHIDYAELFRYETNQIHPPLYGGTLHLTPTQPGEMEGGDLMVNVNGIDHYRKFGYKGKLCSEEEMNEDLRSSDWLTVPYRCNRGIIFDGSFPHLSTRVRSLPSGTKRVILGFNWFSNKVAECCYRAPEHSDAFNRTIRLYQALSGTTGSKYDSQSTQTAISPPPPPSEDMPPTSKKSGGLTVKDLKANPSLAKLLVLAARKVKSKQSSPTTEPSTPLP